MYWFYKLFYLQSLDISYLFFILWGILLLTIWDWFLTWFFTHAIITMSIYFQRNNYFIYPLIMFWRMITQHVHYLQSSKNVLVFLDFTGNSRAQKPNKVQTKWVNKRVYIIFARINMWWFQQEGWHILTKITYTMVYFTLFILAVGHYLLLDTTNNIILWHIKFFLWQMVIIPR